MIFYYSGLRGERELALLKPLGDVPVLVDQFDVASAAGYSNVMLDSGAYLAWKEGRTLTLANYLKVIASREFSRITSLDRFQDPAASYNNWLTMQRMLPPALLPKLMPVWPWGSDREQLTEYLDAAEVVGIGGLVPLLRRRRKNEEQPEVPREKTLENLVDLAADHPGRFHAFGLCWTKAIDALWDLLYSADTSHWLTPLRSRRMILLHEGYGYLQDAPMGVLGYDQQDAQSVAQACTAGAQALLDFQPVQWKCTRCDAAAPHHKMRLLRARERRCTCGGEIRTRK